MIIIIGAGIASLFLGYLLKQDNKDFIIFEKEDRYGGRIHMANFLNKQVVLGAGIGRLNKDRLLYNLCKKLNVPTSIYNKNINYSFQVKKPLLEYVNELKLIARNLTPEKRSKLTFLDFLKQNLRNSTDFTKICGYTDYINADIIDTLYDYGFDDNISGGQAFSVKWKILIDKLYLMLKDNIRLNECVEKVNTKKSIIITNKGVYNYTKLVCSSTVNVSRSLFNIDILNDLECQTFSRIYAKIKNFNLKSFTIVDSFLQKIIPIDTKEGIYMIGYNDNEDADKGFEYFTTLEDKDIYKIIENEIKKNFNINTKVEVSNIAYWNCGTTYYKPLKTKYKNREEWLRIAQNPLNGVYFIGEGYSRNQGWVEGSLESVINIYNNI